MVVNISIENSNRSLQRKWDTILCAELQTQIANISSSDTEKERILANNTKESGV